MEKNFVNEREARVENNNTVVNTEAPATEAPQENNSKKIFGMQPKTAKKVGWWTLVTAGVVATGWGGYKLYGWAKKKISAKKNAEAEADGKEKVENRGDEAK